MSVQESTRLTTINQYLRCQRLSIFGHIARLDPAVFANAALRLAVDTKEGRRPDPSWSRRPGRPQHTWADQVREDAGIPLSTLWSAEVAKGHGAARRSSTRRQWWWWWFSSQFLDIVDIFPPSYVGLGCSNISILIILMHTWYIRARSKISCFQIVCAHKSTSHICSK